jgi:hypothetical protein
VLARWPRDACAIRTARTINPKRARRNRSRREKQIATRFGPRIAYMSALL